MNAVVSVWTQYVLVIRCLQTLPRTSPFVLVYLLLVLVGDTAMIARFVSVCLRPIMPALYLLVLFTLVWNVLSEHVYK